MSEVVPAPAGDDLPAARQGPKVHPSTLLAAAAVLLSGTLLLHWLSRLTFSLDEWAFVTRRPWSADTFLDPFVEQLLAIPILIYKVLLTTFGMDSAAPFQVVHVFLFLLSVVLVFVYVRRRVGGWLALAAILPILFLGLAWEALLQPFQMPFFGSMACGLGALLALERRDRGGDVAATLLLIASLLFSHGGIPFVAGAMVELALRRGSLERLYIVAVPTALWVLWYAGWGHAADTHLSFENFANLPNYVLDGLASSLASFFGLGALVGNSRLDWGRPLLLAAVALGILRIDRVGKPSDRALVILTILLGFWSLTALNASDFALATAGRYQYVGVILIVLLAAELLDGITVGPRMTVGILIVASWAALANGNRLSDAADGLATFAENERGALTAVEFARGQVDPDFELSTENSGVNQFGHFEAGPYLSAVDDYGSPAYSPEELAESAPESARETADKVSAAALHIKLAETRGIPVGRCIRVPPGNTPALIPLPSAGVVLRPLADGLQVALRRYATLSSPAALGSIPAGHEALLRIPPDQSPRQWIVDLRVAPVDVCQPQ